MKYNLFYIKLKDKNNINLNKNKTLELIKRVFGII